MWITMLLASLFLFIGEINAACAQAGPPDPGPRLSTPPELMVKAGEYFPPELAKQVQDKIAREVLIERQRQGPVVGEQSPLTLYLADAFYDKTKTGKFESAPRVTWNGFDPASNTPMFVFEKSQFAFVTSSNRKIAPGTMDTDGGSIPKILHSVGSFTPWGYGPAYIIHDWLFVAHKCKVAPDNSTTFEESATILAEAIKTLMETGFENYDKQTQKFPKKEDSLYLIYQAVSTDYAKRLWDNVNSVKCRT